MNVSTLNRSVIVLVSSSIYNILNDCDHLCNVCQRLLHFELIIFHLFSRIPLFHRCFPYLFDVEVIFLVLSVLKLYKLQIYIYILFTSDFYTPHLKPCTEYFIYFLNYYCIFEQCTLIDTLIFDLLTT